MKKFISTIFSMKFAGMLLLLFAAVIGVATFIENDLGTSAAKDIVYNALWFEILLFITTVSLIGSVFHYRLFQRKKYSVLFFHLGFAVILAGAFITRHMGYEGIMKIREGETTNKIITLTPYLQVWAEDADQTYYFDKEKKFTPYKNNRYSHGLKIGSDEFSISFRDIIMNAAERIVEDPEGKPMISFLTIEKGSRRNTFITYGDEVKVGSIILSFKDHDNTSESVILSLEDGLFQFIAPFEVILFDMMTNHSDTLQQGQAHEINLKKIYYFKEHQIVFANTFNSAKTKIVSTSTESGSDGSHAYVFDVTYQDKEREITVFGGPGTLPNPTRFKMNGLNITIAYGSKQMEVPFSLKLVDFRLERYPGSMSPSSFQSDVIVIDAAEGIEMPYQIFMNNVLNYGGFRFFQSSYDKDEKGTVLSVNHDKWGTIITYIGYFILTLGLILNFFSRSSRFQTLARNASRIKAAAKESSMAGIIILFIAMSGISSPLLSQVDYATPIVEIDKGHAARFGSLLVQDNDGRIKPLNTMSSEVLRKIYRKNSLEGLNPDQVLLGILTNPSRWQSYPMIKVTDGDLKKIIGIQGKYASFYDFIDEQGNYKLREHIDLSYSKSPAERISFDKDIIKVDERVNIIYMAYTGEMLTIFPKPNDPGNKWYSNFNPELVFDSVDAGFVANILPLYYGAVNEAVESGDWSKADEYLGYLKHFQLKYGGDVLPAESKTNLEILYNNVNIFKRLFPIYSLLGLIMLILVFIGVINPKLKFSLVIKILMGLIAIAFLMHTAGLAARWYIAGRAPWSNGYETMIYISWGIVLSGLFFARTSKITLATTAILASLTLMVANLSWLDPEITNLVPVLKSYWLVIHVAVITASYSFLAIGALLGFLNLLLINFLNPANKIKIKLMLDELTNIIEMNLIIGVFLITIGTFLGAVWANESWGRYWGWDPKETWALVTVLVYSFVVHMRLIPGMNGNFAFNFASLISFSSVLMTYFGVNYFLSGMHSYAQGDAVKVPMFVYWSILIIAAVSIMAYVNYRRVLKQ